MIIIDKNNPPSTADEMKAAFYRRPEIELLTPDEQDARWLRFQARCAQLWSALDGMAVAESLEEGVSIVEGIVCKRP